MCKSDKDGKMTVDFLCTPTVGVVFFFSIWQSPPKQTPKSTTRQQWLIIAFFPTKAFYTDSISVKTEIRVQFLMYYVVDGNDFLKRKLLIIIW